MKYDTHILYVLQNAVDYIKETSFLSQKGIYYEIKNHEYEFGYDILCWIQDKYMPQWWPISLSYSDETLRQAKKDTIEFLERIIEDLMCGE